MLVCSFLSYVSAWNRYVPGHAEAKYRCPAGTPGYEPLGSLRTEHSRVRPRLYFQPRCLSSSVQPRFTLRQTVTGHPVVFLVFSSHFYDFGGIAGKTRSVCGVRYPTCLGMSRGQTVTCAVKVAFLFRTLCFECTTPALRPCQAHNEDLPS
jgi:hypothetical protein